MLSKGRVNSQILLIFALLCWGGSTAFATPPIKNPAAYYTLQEDGGYLVSDDLTANEQEFLSQEKLPSKVKEFLNYERFLNDRTNHKDFDSIKQQQVPAVGRPENGVVLKLWSVEVPFSELEMYGDAQVPLPEQLLVHKDGKKYFKFLVHPFSFFIYKERFKNFPWSLEYLAIPTASYRSLIAWRPEAPKDPLYVKLSFDVKLGGFTRHIFLSDVHKSPTVTEIMQSLTPKVKTALQFEYIPETHALIPMGLKSGGMIIRDVGLIKKHTAVPLFALFSKKFKQLNLKKVKHDTLLGALITESGAAPEDFVENNFIRPLVRMALFFRFVLGMNSQLHEQNVLFCYDCFLKGKPKFLIRDSEQFYMDLAGQLTLEENAFSHLPYLTKKPLIPRPFVAAGVENSVDEFKSYIRDSTLYALQVGVSAEYPQITLKWMNAKFSEVLRQEMEPYLNKRPRDLSQAKKLANDYFDLLKPPVKTPCAELLLQGSK